MAGSGVALRGVMLKFRRDCSHCATKQARGVRGTLLAAVAGDSRGAVRAALKFMFVPNRNTMTWSSEKSRSTGRGHWVAGHPEEMHTYQVGKVRYLIIKV